jgi:Phage terminase small subunit
MPEAWERQKGESRKAYEAFRIYRDMGATRSLAKVAEKLGKSKTLIERWSRRDNWVERCRQYDEYMEREYLLQQIEERRKMAERHAKQAMIFQNKVLERLRSLNPKELSPNDLIRWFDIAVKIERLSRGESTEIQQVEHSGEVKQSHELDITAKIEQYASVYEKIAENSEIESDNEGDDT